MASGCLILAGGFASALVWQSARGSVVPWVVQVDNLGQAQTVAPAAADYRPTDPQIAWHFGRFIEQVRAIPAETHRRFGYRRLHVILRRDGHVLNRKRTQRLYREEGLSVRRRCSRKRAIGARAPLVTAAMANARWSVDFVHDQFADGRRFRSIPYWRWW